MRSQVALLSLIALLLLAGCGGSERSSTSGPSSSPAALIQQTFGSDRAVKSGRITLAAKGQAEGTGAFDLRVQAKFDQAAKGQLPKLDGTLSITSSGGTLRAGAISTGTKGYLVVGGRAYEVPADQFAAFTKRFLGDRSATAKRAATRPSLAALGIHPQAWLTNPRNAGERTIGDTETIHLTAGVDVPKLLADLSTLAKRNGLSRRLSAADLQAVSGAVRSATVDVDTGADDHRLRQLVVHLTLIGGNVDLTLRYGDLDQPQTITAPKDPRPLSELRGTTTAPSGQQQRYADCLQAAGTDLAKVQACAKYL